MSFLIILPSSPLPNTCEIFTPESAAIFFANGEAFTLPFPDDAGTGISFDEVATIVGAPTVSTLADSTFTSGLETATGSAVEPAPARAAL